MVLPVQGCAALYNEALLPERMRISRTRHRRPTYRVCPRAECGRDVMGSRGRSAVREILLGSVVRATLRNPHRPVMVVPRPRSAREQH